MVKRYIRNTGPTSALIKLDQSLQAESKMILQKSSRLKFGSKLPVARMGLRVLLDDSDMFLIYLAVYGLDFCTNGGTSCFRLRVSQGSL